MGCSKNLVDSENLATQLSFNGYSYTFDENAAAENIIINTCGFIADAKEESIDTILESIEQKKLGIYDHVYVMGCLSERYKKELHKEITEIDQIFGVGEEEKILQYFEGNKKANPKRIRHISTPRHYAFLKIAEGCNKKCAFCIIPKIRGKHRSFPFEALLTEARQLSQNGVKELILISQDLGFYGKDIKNDFNLINLLEALEKIKTLEWIRLHYLSPQDITDGLIQKIKTSKKICHYFDVPLQHVNTELLKKMNRSYKKEDITNMVRKIREQIPDATIRTSFITGFPGETEAMFQELSEEIIRLKFDRIGVFTYSHEEGTPAYSYPDTISDNTKQHRLEKIMELQHDISYQNNQKLVGKTISVIIDREEDDSYFGRTQGDSPDIDNEVIILKTSNKTNHIIGQIVNVKIQEAFPYDLKGELEP